MRQTIFGIFLAALCANTAVAKEPQAALEVILGSVYVDQGNGLVKAAPASQLLANDKVFLKAGSAALLSSLDGGCIVSLREAGIYVVPDFTDCNAGQASVLPSDFSIVPANGVPPPPSPEAVYGGYANAAGASNSAILMGVGFAAVTVAAATYTAVTEQEVVEMPVSAH